MNWEKSLAMDIPILVALAIGFLGGLAFLVFSFGNRDGKTSKKLVTGPAAEDLATSTGKVFLDKTRKSVPLVEKIELSSDTRLFRFALPEKDMVLGLPVGKHFKVWCPNPKRRKVPGQWNGAEDPETGDEIERKYTPTSSDDDLGHFDLVIKVYRGGEIERFPDGGKMSQYFESLKIGDHVELAGPYGLYEYKGHGEIQKMRKCIVYKRLGMLSGGTGITPMLQVIAAVLKNENDKTEISLIFANKTEGDILVRKELEEWQAKHPDRFKLHYTLDNPPEGWNYSKGFIDADMIQKHMPPPGQDTAILMCGPPPMIKYACKPNLEKLGYSKDSMIEF